MKKLSTDVEIKVANPVHHLKLKEGLQSMKTILGTSRHQMQFSSLDDFIAADNPVRIIDAFTEKLDLQKIGIVQHSDNKRKNHPGGAPALMTSYC